MNEVEKGAPGYPDRENAWTSDVARVGDDRLIVCKCLWPRSRKVEVCCYAQDRSATDITRRETEVPGGAEERGCAGYGQMKWETGKECDAESGELNGADGLPQRQRQFAVTQRKAANEGGKRAEAAERGHVLRPRAGSTHARQQIVACWDLELSLLADPPARGPPRHAESCQHPRGPGEVRKLLAEEGGGVCRMA